jgi:hypothetical protein
MQAAPARSFRSRCASTAMAMAFSKIDMLGLASE